MRISDWSSDVCSSDLPPSRSARASSFHGRHIDENGEAGRTSGLPRPSGTSATRGRAPAAADRPAIGGFGAFLRDKRSEDRRVGKCVSVRLDFGCRRFINTKIFFFLHFFSFFYFLFYFSFFF